MYISDRIGTVTYVLHHISLLMVCYTHQLTTINVPSTDKIHNKIKSDIWCVQAVFIIHYLYTKNDEVFNIQRVYPYMPIFWIHL